MSNCQELSLYSSYWSHWWCSSKNKWQEVFSLLLSISLMKLLHNWLIGILNTREEKTLKAGVGGVGKDQTKQDSVVRNLLLSTIGSHGRVRNVTEKWSTICFEKIILWCRTFLKKCRWEVELTMVCSHSPRDMTVAWTSASSLEMMRNREVTFVDFYLWSGNEETN